MGGLTGTVVSLEAGGSKRFVNGGLDGGCIKKPAVSGWFIRILGGGGVRINRLQSHLNLHIKLMIFLKN